MVTLERGIFIFFPFDPEGQERFTSMTRLYYRDASACVIMFDVTNVSTFSNSQKWKQDLDSKLMLPDGNPVPCLLLANKVSSSRGAPGVRVSVCVPRSADWKETPLALSLARSCPTACGLFNPFLNSS